MSIFVTYVEGNIVNANKKVITRLGSPSVNATKKINVLKYPPLI